MSLCTIDKLDKQHEQKMAREKK